MSSIGFSNIGALNVAGSAAGTQSGGTDTDRVKQNGATQKAAADRTAQSARALSDVGETDHSSDRDADGRQPLGYLSRPAAENDQEECAERSARPADAEGARGHALDLQA